MPELRIFTLLILMLLNISFVSAADTTTSNGHNEPQIIITSLLP